jgi:3-phenylpropionate/trans-cinnamate dioxygenase ferredoxin reductase subunit
MQVEDRIVVVGASLAGLRTIEALRDRGYAGEIIAICAEPHMPYDRPPLSKQYLAGKWDAPKLSLRRDGFADLNVDWRLGHAATALHPERKCITVEGSEGVEDIEYGQLLIATGSTPRRLPFGAELDGIHVLRSLDDADALAGELRPGARLVVIGAGFIGMEAAATARALGAEVTVVEALDVPLQRGLGAVLGVWVGEVHRGQGVDLRCGVGVDGFEGEGRVRAVRLADGTVVEADAVLVGIGVMPACDWLAGSGLDVENGVLCDAKGATALPDVFAAGDAARWFNPRVDRPVRYEHWTSAVEQSGVVAARMLDGDAATEPLSSVPYVWSDQFELRIAIVGEIGAEDEMVIRHGSLEEGRFLALFGTADRFTGAVGMRRPRQLNACRKLLAAGASFAEAVEANTDPPSA